MWRSEIQRVSHEAKKSRCQEAGSFWRLRGTLCCHFFPAYIPQLMASSSISRLHPSDLPSAHLLSLRLTCWLPSRKDPCDHIGPHLDHPGDPSHCKVLNGITSVGRVMVPRGLPGGSVVKNLLANVGDTGSIPGLGRSHMCLKAARPVGHNY